MNRYVQIILVLSLFFILAACGDNKSEATQDEVLDLDVEFILPETADVGEEVEFNVVVTYGDEKVTDASQMDFEIWERGKEDESETIDAKNNDDGSYTITYTFDDDGIYETYAHTTANHIHTMPKKEIQIGEGGDYEDTKDGYHTEGFDIHFVEVEDAVAGEEQSLVAHIMLNEDAYEELEVRYEIVTSGEHDWIDATEDPAGEYSAAYVFDKVREYKITIHVEDDDELHEDTTVEVEVTE